MITYSDKKILLVDDDQDFLGMLSLALTRAGFNDFLTAYSGAEAIAYYNRKTGKWKFADTIETNKRYTKSVDRTKGALKYFISVNAG